MVQVGVTVAAAVAKDGETVAAAAVNTASAADGSKEVQPTPKLSTEELRVMATR